MGTGLRGGQKWVEIPGAAVRGLCGVWSSLRFTRPGTDMAPEARQAGDWASVCERSVESETTGAVLEQDWCTGHLLQELRKARCLCEKIKVLRTGPLPALSSSIKQVHPGLQTLLIGALKTHMAEHKIGMFIVNI